MGEFVCIHATNPVLLDDSKASNFAPCERIRSKEKFFTNTHSVIMRSLFQF